MWIILNVKCLPILLNNTNQHNQYMEIDRKRFTSRSFKNFVIYQTRPRYMPKRSNLFVYFINSICSLRLSRSYDLTLDCIYAKRLSVRFLVIHSSLNRCATKNTCLLAYLARWRILVWTHPVYASLFLAVCQEGVDHAQLPWRQSFYL